MSNFLLAILIGLTTLFSKPLEAAQSENRSTQQAISESGLLFSQAKKLLDSGDPKAAIPLFEKSLEIEEKALGPEHSSLAGTLGNLGIACSEIGDYKKSVSFLKRSASIIEKAVGTKNPALAMVQTQLGCDYQSLGNYEKSVLSFEYALKVYEKTHGPKSPEVAGVLQDLGCTYSMMGENERAVSLLQKVT